MSEPVEQFEEGELDAMLRRSLRVRPEPIAAVNLVSRAMSLAARPSDALLELSRVRRWNRLLTTAAAIMIICLSAWVVHSRLAAGGFQAWSDTATSTDSTSTISSDGSTSSDSSTTAMQWMFAGAAMAVGAVVVVVTQRALSASDEWMAGWARVQG